MFLRTMRLVQAARLPFYPFRQYSAANHELAPLSGTEWECSTALVCIKLILLVHSLRYSSTLGVFAIAIALPSTRNE